MNIYSIGTWHLVITIIVFLLLYAPIIVALVDIYNGQFRKNKWTWFIIVLLFNYIGVVLYLLIGRQEKIK